MKSCFHFFPVTTPCSSSTSKQLLLSTKDMASGNTSKSPLEVIPAVTAGKTDPIEENKEGEAEPIDVNTKSSLGKNLDPDSSQMDDNDVNTHCCPSDNVLHEGISKGQDCQQHFKTNAKCDKVWNASSKQPSSPSALNLRELLDTPPSSMTSASSPSSSASCPEYLHGPSMEMPMTRSFSTGSNGQSNWLTSHGSRNSSTAQMTTDDKSDSNSSDDQKDDEISLEVPSKPEMLPSIPSGAEVDIVDGVQIMSFECLEDLEKFTHEEDARLGRIESKQRVIRKSMNRTLSKQSLNGERKSLMSSLGLNSDLVLKTPGIKKTASETIGSRSQATSVSSAFMSSSLDDYLTLAKSSLSLSVPKPTALGAPPKSSKIYDAGILKIDSFGKNKGGRKTGLASTPLSVVTSNTNSLAVGLPSHDNESDNSLRTQNTNTKKRKYTFWKRKPADKSRLSENQRIGYFKGKSNRKSLLPSASSTPVDTNIFKKIPKKTKNMVGDDKETAFNFLMQTVREDMKNQIKAVNVSFVMDMEYLSFALETVKNPSFKTAFIQDSIPSTSKRTLDDFLDFEDKPKKKRGRKSKAEKESQGDELSAMISRHSKRDIRLPARYQGTLVGNNIVPEAMASEMTVITEKVARNRLIKEQKRLQRIKTPVLDRSLLQETFVVDNDQPCASSVPSSVPKVVLGRPRGRPPSSSRLSQAFNPRPILPVTPVSFPSNSVEPKVTSSAPSTLLQVPNKPSSHLSPDELNDAETAFNKKSRKGVKRQPLITMRQWMKKKEEMAIREKLQSPKESLGRIPGNSSVRQTNGRVSWNEANDVTASQPLATSSGVDNPVPSTSNGMGLLASPAQYQFLAQQNRNIRQQYINRVSSCQEVLVSSSKRKSPVKLMAPVKVVPPSDVHQTTKEEVRELYRKLFVTIDVSREKHYKEIGMKPRVNKSQVVDEAIVVIERYKRKEQQLQYISKLMRAWNEKLIACYQVLNNCVPVSDMASPATKKRKIQTVDNVIKAYQTSVCHQVAQKLEEQQREGRKSIHPISLDLAKVGNSLHVAAPSSTSLGHPPRLSNGSHTSVPSASSSCSSLPRHPVSTFSRVNVFSSQTSPLPKKPKTVSLLKRSSSPSVPHIQRRHSSLVDEDHPHSDAVCHEVMTVDTPPPPLVMNAPIPQEACPVDKELALSQKMPVLEKYQRTESNVGNKGRKIQEIILIDSDN